MSFDTIEINLVLFIHSFVQQINNSIGHQVNISKQLILNSTNKKGLAWVSLLFLGGMLAHSFVSFRQQKFRPLLSKVGS